MERDTRRRRRKSRNDDPRPSGRRRNKRSPLSNSMLYIVMVCAVSIVLAAVGWSLANDMLALNKDKVTATIVVDDENDFGSVVDQLKDNDKNKGQCPPLPPPRRRGKGQECPGGPPGGGGRGDWPAIFKVLGVGLHRGGGGGHPPWGGSPAGRSLSWWRGGVHRGEAQRHGGQPRLCLLLPGGHPPGRPPNRLEGYLFPDTYNFYMGRTPSMSSIRCW